ncbi:MAG: DUF3179 domain-containing protein [Silicimonas sp.]|nr:DUF3179 domain-containing protein [Silicimonas sp.]
MIYPTRRALLAGGAAFAAMARGLRAQANPEELPVGPLLFSLLERDPQVVLGSLNLIAERGGTDLISALILASRFGIRGAFDPTLQFLTGESRMGWFDWMLWQEDNPQIASHPEYIRFKRAIFLQIDPNFDLFLKPEYLEPDAMKIRFEEVTWGGVRKDGIPALNGPRLIPAAEAEYLRDDDLVFGVSINGDVRAYPLRIMGWHEMFNEVIGGVPVALAYCTLCGAGILFETQLGSDDPLMFGSSGFLYRSNKLMFDRKTHSLWNQFTGKPVSGPLVDSGIALKQRPVVITDWASWRAANPGTQVLAVETGFLRDYGSGVVYQEYFASPDLMFPARLKGDDLAQKDYVFGVRLAGGAKAWPLAAFEGGRVINDQVGFHNLVLIGDAAGRTVRAYDRGDLEFSADLTAGGVTWEATEGALVAPDGRRAPRVAGHVAYWFAWAGYLGEEAAFYRP